MSESSRSRADKWIRMQLFITLWALQFITQVFGTQTITIESAAKMVQQGSDVTIEATFAQDVSDPSQLSWIVLDIVLVKISDTQPGGAHHADYRAEYIPSSRTARLTVLAANINDDGKYACQLTAGGDNNIRSTELVLTVLIPPASVEISGGGTQTVVEGQDYNLTCTATGSRPSVTIAWLAAGAAATETSITTVLNAQALLLTTVSVLTIKGAYEINNKKYACQVSGPMMTSPRVTETLLQVHYKPKVDMTVSNGYSYFREGTTVTLTCTADASPSLVSWRWMLGGVDVPKETSASISFTNIGFDSNNKVVKCEATNSIGAASKELKLDVHYGPRFTTTPVNVQVNLNDSAEFNCAVDGNPSPVVIWQRDGSNVIAATSNKLAFSSVKMDDIGAYKCIGSVNTFPNIEASAHLLLKGRPVIFGQREFSFGQGQTAILTCEATCIPNPTKVIWRRGRDGTPINITSGRFSEIIEQDVSVYKSMLKIADLASNDFGEYNCTIVNDYGNDTQIIKLSQTDDFPWMYITIAVCCALGVALSITAICCCLRRKKKSSSAGCQTPLWVELPQRPLYEGSLSVVSNTTDNSIKKPADGMEQIETSSLPDFGPRPIDMWKQTNTHIGYDSVDYPKPEFYGSYHAGPTSTFNHHYPQPNYGTNSRYGTYRSDQGRTTPLYGTYHAEQARDGSISPPPFPDQNYPTLPLHPRDYNIRYNATSYMPQNLPDPPIESRLATNV